MVEPAEAEPVETTEPAEAEPATVESEPRLEKKTADAARTQVTVENPEHDTVIDVDFADGELDLRDYDQGQEEVTGAHLIASFAQRDRLVDRLGERDTVINKLVDAIGNRDEAIEHRDQMIGMLVERDRLIERLFARLDERDAVINRLAEAIGKRDKAIEQRDQMITVLIEKVERYAQPEPAVRPGTPEPARTDRPLAHHGGQHTVSHPMSSQPVDTVEVPRRGPPPSPSRAGPCAVGCPGSGPVQRPRSVTVRACRAPPKTALTSAYSPPPSWPRCRWEWSADRPLVSRGLPPWCPRGYRRSGRRTRDLSHS